MSEAERISRTKGTISEGSFLQMNRAHYLSMNNYADQLKLCLEKEFCADVFEEMYILAWRAAKSVDRPLGFFLLWMMFNRLDRHWRDRPLTDKTATRMEEHL